MNLGPLAESVRGADQLRLIMEDAQATGSTALVPLPERGSELTSPAPHEQTVSEAKEVWRNEGNPN